MIEYFAAFVAVLLIWGVLKYMKWRREIYIPLEKLPGPKAYPFVGNLYMFFGVKRADIFNIFVDMVKKYGPLFRAYNGFNPLIDITKPEHLEVILSSSVHIQKGSVYSVLKEWLGEGLLISNGTKWHQRRKLITPTFHFKILEHFMTIFVEKSKLLIDYLEETKGKPFDIFPYISHCTLDIICETAMGVSINAMSERNNSYIQAIYNTGELILKRQTSIIKQTPLYPFLKDGKAFNENLKTLHNFTGKVIKERKQILKENPLKIEKDDFTMSGKKRLSLLDLLLTSSYELSDGDIRAEVDTFMFAGHDTTTTSICWNLFLFGLNQDIQQRVYEEIEDVLGDKQTPESISDLNELKYLECCIKEGLRIFPSVPVISRRLTEDIMLDGYKIPKGTDCNMDIYHAHRNPEIYPDPEKYDPDRFLPDNCKNRHPYAYIPFSAGPRNCVGQKFAMYEEKTLLASILKTYRVIPVDTRDTISLVSEVVLRSYDGLKISLEKRQK